MMSRWLAPLLLLACTAAPANKPTPEQPVLPVTPVTPEQPALPVTPVTPELPVTPATPAVPAAPAEPAVSWWCVCYARTTATGGEPVTACRASEAACHSLAAAVAAGRKGMVPRSLTHRCQVASGAHPGDVYGGRDAWQPSKKAGGWLSVGACQLPGEGERVQAGNDTNTLPDDRLGELSEGMAAADVLAKLGEPGKRGRISEEEATGLFLQTWDYPDQGLTVMMGAPARRGPQTIHSLQIVAPSTLTTRLGVGIGSPRKDVLARYGKFRDPDDPSGDAEEVFIAGSVYGGIFFTMKADKVVEIFMGAGAE